MSKKKIWFLAIIMTLGLLGLILVQGYWIKKAVILKEQQFRHFVNQSLTAVINELELREALLYVVDELALSEVDSSGKQFLNNFSPYSIISFQSEKEKDKIRGINIETNTSFYQQIFYLSENLQNNSFSISDSIGLSIIGSNMSGLTEMFSYPYQIFNAYLRRKANNKTVIINTVMNKMIKKKLEIEERIDFNTINKLLEMEFKKRGININYQFAVKKVNAGLVCKTNDFKTKTKSDVYMRALFPNDLFSSKAYLTLYFPKEKKLFYKSLGFMGASSTFLTIFLIMTFIATLLIIFRQKKLSQIKTDFVNNMTHELKTPISTISLASQMLKDKGIGITEKKLNHILGIIEQESKRLGYQVEKVLQMAIFDKGKIKLNRKEIDVHLLLSNVASNFEMQVANKNGNIILDLNAKKLIIKADEVHFSNILSNLADNAIKYCSAKPEITLSAWDTRKKLFIAVKDNGIGISKKDQKRIFEKFYRVSTGNIHNVKGFGLGLCYVKTIVEEHGGSINIESQTGKGTRFILSFPFNNNHG
ncbi:MAG: HAMP domain-containing histidine kinase [Bacteroidales bacterium]|nr:HAMP domain-containing histidine kinase [Bacteroidales bacterium]